MVVVTSPIGDQAPPALAAITMVPARNRRVLVLVQKLALIHRHHTIVVVRLSRIALSTKVTRRISNIRVGNWVV